MTDTYYTLAGPGVINHLVGLARTECSITTVEGWGETITARETGANKFQ